MLKTIKGQRNSYWPAVIDQVNLCNPRAIRFYQFLCVKVIKLYLMKAGKPHKKEYTTHETQKDCQTWSFYNSFRPYLDLVASPFEWHKETSLQLRLNTT